MVEEDELELALVCQRIALFWSQLESRIEWRENQLVGRAPAVAARIERPANTPALRVVRIPSAAKRM